MQNSLDSFNNDQFWSDILFSSDTETKDNLESWEY